ncbi:hypothetical protein CEXT_324091 [Caerostris extrusa]|uniref:Uncharacterized protein n=1 Tax=Caerostris extrusa TaxID=172846 RepID=A0AAV4VSC4_CAEEX|nr:hypothetical protein CEXT_324091 [Caerostris extrusa]
MNILLQSFFHPGPGKWNFEIAFRWRVKMAEFHFQSRGRCRLSQQKSRLLRLRNVVSTFQENINIYRLFVVFLRRWIQTLFKAFYGPELKWNGSLKDSSFNKMG